MTLPRTTKSCRERIERIISVLRDLEQRGDWNEGIRRPLLHKLERLLARQVELCASK